MSRSPSFDLIAYLYAPVWETQFKRKYRGTSRDMGEAKTFLTMNPNCLDESEFVVEFQEHAMEYFNDPYEGWRAQSYPAWGLLKSYNRYEPQKRGQAGVMVILCVDCHAKGIRTIHGVNQSCPKCNP